MATETDSPSQRVEHRRLILSGGLQTTVHLARWNLASTRVRVVQLARQQTVLDWATETGCPDALVGGFYTRPDGLPLGELRIDGRARPHVPFTAPWDRERASLHVARGTVRIDRRRALPAEGDGDLLQAGPLLVADGRVTYVDGIDSEGFSEASQQFDSDITAERHPRAAIAVASGAIIAAVADGRATDEAGLTLGELAEVLVDAGARSAMNLDGGGSASLVCDGQLRNRPREQHGIELKRGRAVTTVIAFSAV